MFVPALNRTSVPVLLFNGIVPLPGVKDRFVAPTFEVVSAITYHTPELYIKRRYPIVSIQKKALLIFEGKVVGVAPPLYISPSPVVCQPKRILLPVAGY